MLQRFVLFLSVLFLLAFTAKQEDDGIISWDAGQSLSWQDFKGTPQTGKAAAFSSCKILRSVAKSTGNTASVKIQTIFLSGQSWKKKQEPGKAALLHEQKHFDIAELHARQLRKLIKMQQYRSIKALQQQADSLYTATEKALNDYQLAYERQTGSAARQRAWNNKIKAALDALDEYRSPVFVIALN